MRERYPKDGDAKAYELAAKWLEKNNAIEALKKEMREIKDDISKYASLKVGDVILEKKTGRKLVVDSVSVDEWYLKWDKPQIAFEYNVHPIKKDGTMSKNSAWVSIDYPNDEYELTDEKL